MTSLFNVEDYSNIFWMKRTKTVILNQNSGY